MTELAPFQPGEVIVVQKTHLDIGFTALPSVVLDQYCESFIPQAIDLARRLADDSDVAFIWTTGAWLIYQALERADASHCRELEEAIAAGWLRWHALPFTTHTELADPLLLRAGLAMGQSLDRRFGLQTRSAKMTDVPGHGIGLVPILAEAGIELLHLGVNPASHLPEVPPAFRWRYGDSEITVLYESGYGRAQPIPGSDAALAFLHTNDNLGPPGIPAIRAEFAALRAQHATATVRAGTLEDVVACVDPSDLPVLEQEIGDSWIHGVGSAPQRVADLLALRRGLASSPANPARTAAAQSALLVAEHTWGLDCKSYLPNHEALAPALFNHERRRKAWQPLEQAYAEQDAYIDEALDAAGEDAALGDTLVASLTASRARRRMPTPADSSAIGDRWQPITTPRWVLRFDPANGVISQLFDRHSGIDLCAGQPGGRLGMLRYQVLGAQRFRNWVESYLLPDEELWWAAEDFDGPQQQGRFDQDLVVPSRADDIWIERGDDCTVLTIGHSFRHPRLAETAAPQSVAVQWTLPDAVDASIVIDVGWDEKQAGLCREALWFGWRAGSVHQPEAIQLDKLGARFEAGSVVDHGGLLHAVDGVELQAAASRTSIRSLDAPLVCPDGPRILETRSGDLDRSRGIWWNLLNTGWSTNFSMWTEGPMGYRFEVDVSGT